MVASHAKVKYTSHREDLRLEVYTIALESFWGNIARCTTNKAKILFVNVSCEAKVCEENIWVLSKSIVYEDVIWLQVTVDDFIQL